MMSSEESGFHRRSENRTNRQWNPPARTTIAEIEALARHGESESIEFKKSTGQLSRAAETICAFLNGHGGLVLIGIAPDRKIAGQIVSDGTLQDIAQRLRRFEPPAPVRIHRIALPDSKCEVVLLQADASNESRPFTFDGRPYERIGSTTSVMPQETYQRLLLERAHTLQRWENLPAALSLEDLDHEEILKTVRLGIDSLRDEVLLNHVEEGTTLDVLGR